LPGAAHPGAVRLQVSNLERSLAYYERVLGLRAQSVTSTRAVLGAHGDEKRLVILQTEPGITSSRRGAFGLYHFALLLPERAALGRFAAHLAALDVRVAMADHLVSEALYLWDPDGLGIEVYADRPRDTWRHSDSELAMTTDPLDIQSVIAAGGGEVWTGAPAGTTMGHVHLHVESLSDAEAFYHRGLGFDKTVWSYPGALFMSAGGYHHHLATNTWSPGPAASLNEARLLEWELMVPFYNDVDAAARHLRHAGYSVEKTVDGVAAQDSSGTRVLIRSER
jgi:catechol 2,3-dioxygenase